jgi:hypothetical protein
MCVVTAASRERSSPRSGGQIVSSRHEAWRRQLRPALHIANRADGQGAQAARLLVRGRLARARSESPTGRRSARRFAAKTAPGRILCRATRKQFHSHVRRPQLTGWRGSDFIHHETTLWSSLDKPMFNNDTASGSMRTVCQKMEVGSPGLVTRSDVSLIRREARALDSYQAQLSQSARFQVFARAGQHNPRHRDSSCREEPAPRGSRSVRASRKSRRNRAACRTPRAECSRHPD